MGGLCQVLQPGSSAALQPEAGELLLLPRLVCRTPQPHHAAGVFLPSGFDPVRPEGSAQRHGLRRRRSPAAPLAACLC
eukprot:scaffold21010_cov25-Phaeocystis_antarctica.AAC.1